jgi:lipid A ethanolaminephosphotransferase
VPCMFSNLGRENFESRTTQHEGLLDVLQRAGLAVLWIDNQSGCKGVCDRVPSVSTSSNTESALCATGECLDGVMLEGLDERIAALDAGRVARGLVIVMHQMGSHGPAYHLRSPADMKRFLPECKTAALQDCSRDQLVNAYDNSIVYTDHFLAQAIGWLKTRADKADTAMIYVADHGESLGENNLYLHGMPYSVAPDVQKHVPWITWVSEGFQRSAGLSMSCLRTAGDQRISHDNYFHSVLGLASVQTSAYVPALDAYAACRGLQGDVAMGDKLRKDRTDPKAS